VEGPAGGLLFFCVRRKEAKEDRICSQVGTQKRDHRKPAAPSCTKYPSPYTLFGRVREGAFPGEKPSPACTARVRTRCLPCRGPSFLLCQKKRSKRRPHLQPSQQTKRDHRKPAAPSCTKNPSPYTLFGRVREGAFPGEKPSPACTAAASTRCLPCRGPSFLLRQKKRSKRRPHLQPNQQTKRDHRTQAVPFCTKYLCPYALFGRVREGAFSGEKPSPACTATASARCLACRGPSFLLCQKKRSKRRPHFHPSWHTKKKPPHTGSPFLTKISMPIYAFREGAGGGFSRGKASSRLHRQSPCPPYLSNTVF